MFPCFDEGGLPLRNFFGYTFKSIVDSLALSLEEAYEKSSSLTLVAHDFGSYIALRYVSEYPKAVTKLVLLDVGVGIDERWWAIAIATSYRLWLALPVFLLSRLHNFVGLLMMILYPWKLIGPTPYETPETMCRNPREIRAFMAYPYFHLLLGALSFDKELVPKFNSRIPTLFIYGTKKRCNFHASSFLTDLSNAKGCEHHALNCGHWVQNEKAEEVVGLMRSWKV